MLNGLAVSAYDAQNNRFYPAIIRKTSGVYAVEPCPDVKTDLLLSPGWIDLHTHFFEGNGFFVDEHPDEIGWKTGCCMLVEAGSIGSFTINSFRKYMEPMIITNFRLFLCISPVGVIFNHENNAMEYLNVEETLHTVEANRDIISGIKVRIGSEVTRGEGVEPLCLAAEVARRADLPLMLHIGGNPPTIDDVEPFLRKGDIVTHIFNGRGGDAWDAEGYPTPATRRMIDRGVIFDVGHGGASFSFEKCEKALRHPLPKISIGTDLHKYSRRSCVIDLATTLTKMIGVGMSLENAIYGVTKLPAEILRLHEWCDMHRLRNATLFRVTYQAGDYSDCCGQTRRFVRKIVPVGVILKDIFYDL